MRTWFSFDYFPLTFVIALVIWSWISFFSVILFG